MNEVTNCFDKAKLNQDFAEKLRDEHPLQLILLIKMHLSFLLELNLNEENEAEIADKKGKKGWLFNKNKKTPSVCTSSSNSRSPDVLPILTPELMQQLMRLIDFLLLDENLRQEGIFRKTGSVSRQNELKFLVNQLKVLKLDDEEYTAHDVASVLKSILNDLPEPILSECYFSAYSQIAEICNSKENDEKDRIRTSLQLLYLLLPEENRVILKRLIILLHAASELESHNKMNADSLATLFTPHLVCPRKLQPEVLHQTAATMTRVISFMITHSSSIFLVPERLATDIRAYFAEQKRRRETPEKVLDESVSDSVANTVFTFVDREKTAEAHGQSTTDTALAQLYAYIQSMPESTKKKKLIKQFNKQNGHGTPLQYINREKQHTSSACRSIGDSIKKHIFHKTLLKTPKPSSSNTPSSAKITKTPLIAVNPNKRILFQSPACPSPIVELKPPQVTATVTSASIKTELFPSSSSSSSTAPCAQTNETHIKNEIQVDETTAVVDEKQNEQPQQQPEEEMIDDEDFVDSSEDEMGNGSDNDDDQEEKLACPIIDRNKFPLDEMEHKTLLPQGNATPLKKTFFKSQLVKGLSLGNLMSSFRSPSRSPKIKKSKSSSIINDIEKDDEKRKLLIRSGTESFESSGESDLYFSMDHTKESWHVDDVSNINYFLNQTGMQEQHQVRNSMSPITKSTQRMPKSMQESIMTPRSRKPVMITMFGNNSSDPKAYQTNISQLLEESEEISSPHTSGSKESSAGSSIPLLMNTDDIAAANDNGLPTVEDEENPSGLSSAFKKYLYSRGNYACEEQDDYSFSSQPDDYESSSEYQKLEESNDEQHASTQEIEKIMSKSTSMSKSLLHVLDGNDLSQISPQTSFEKSKKRQLELDESNKKDEELSQESCKKPLLDNFENDLTDF